MIQKTLEDVKNLVFPEIENYLKDPEFPDEFKIPPKYKNDIDNYWKIIKEYPLRKGKYLRPALVILAAEAFGVDPKKAVKVAAAMQLSEEWLLIHDDIQDGSSQRRGEKTLHLLYGTELAINAGDSLQTLMWKVISDNRKVFGDEKTAKIIDEFFKALFRTEHGQAFEIMKTKEKNRKITDSDWFFIADGKTAYYTFVLPLRLGGVIAGATEKNLRSLTKFGLFLGRSFQLIDDILDQETDKKEGKITIPLLKGEDYARKLAEEMKEKAMDIFNNELAFLSKEPARTSIIEIVEFITSREN